MIGQKLRETGLLRVWLHWQKVTGHVPPCELSTGHFPVDENSHAAMPVVQSNPMQTIIDRRPIAFDTLHEVEPVEQYQSGDGRALIIALRNLKDRQKIIMVQSGSSRAYINEGGN